MNDKLKNKITLLLSIITFIIIVLFTITNLLSINKIMITDSLANYMFSHAIRIGEIPYNDFNIITTPLYAFITSIGLFIFDDYLVFLIENIIMIIIILILVYKLLKESTIYYLPVLAILSLIFFSLFPTYNLLCILLLLLLVLFEKENKSDLLIGIIIGLLILSKHTIGACAFIAGILLVIRNRKRLLKRLLGVFIPMLIFLIYLLITKSLFNFINLCVLGLFDFSNKNGGFLRPLSIISYILIILSIYLIIRFKDKKYNKTPLYYSIVSVSFALPIFDTYHFSMFLTVYALFIIIFLKDNKIFKINKQYLKHINIFFYTSYIILLLSLFINLFDYYYTFYTEKKYLLKQNHFKVTIVVGDEMFSTYNELKNKYKYYNQKGNVIMMGQWSKIIDLTTNHKITYFNVMLYGNFGYDIETKSTQLINELEDTYIFIERSNTKKSKNEYSQYYYPAYKYVKDNYEKIDSTKEYDIYYKK